MWQDYFTPSTQQEALRLLAEHAPSARLIAGGTDLVLELAQGSGSTPALIDITRAHGLDLIHETKDGAIHLGPLVTHNQVISSAVCLNHALPLAQACLSVGSAQIRNRATVAGNLITASPANDTITPLMALDARITLASSQRGERTIPLRSFYCGVRRTSLLPDEMMTDIAFAPLAGNERGMFIKLGLRRAMAIAVANVAVVLAFDEERVIGARIALGSVAPTVLRAPEAEASLIGQPLSDAVIERAAGLCAAAARPIDDVRATADYRRRIVKALIQKALGTVRENRQMEDWPASPAKLWGATDGRHPRLHGHVMHHAADQASPIETVINGRPYVISGANDKTLLQLLRDHAGLMGTKEGCGEGECGSCTVLLDGQAVLSCLVPAPRAHGARVTTVEGLENDGQLSNLQQTFVDRGAVQCGYCIPGILIAGEALLQEEPHPTRQTIQQALAGNLCRCTGYYKIVEAIELAAQRQGSPEEPGL
jgi:xanthine dehydrogenase iron-sulfur cluster and FAD-binding subunit A